MNKKRLLFCAILVGGINVCVIAAENSKSKQFEEFVLVKGGSF